MLDKTFVFCYDNIGNIVNAKTYTYTTSLVPSESLLLDERTFTYGDATHVDRLTKFGTTAITYNANGEMTSFDGWDYSWSKGKLSSISKTVTSGSSGTLSRAKPILPPISTTTKTYTYDFTYNAFGQRTGINYSCVVTPVSSTTISELTDYTKEFCYDNSGRLMLEKVQKTYYQDGTASYTILYLYDGNSMIGMEYQTACSSRFYAQNCPRIWVMFLTENVKSNTKCEHRI